jgi:hypothetical protein
VCAEHIEWMWQGVKGSQNYFCPLLNPREGGTEREGYGRIHIGDTTQTQELASNNNFYVINLVD